MNGQKPTIVINSNCAGAFLAAELRCLPQINNNFDVHWIRNFSVRAPGDEPFDESIIPRCAIWLEQIGDFRGDPRRKDGDLRDVPLPALCKRVRFPPLFMNTLWPFIAADARSEAYRLPWMVEGPYPKYVCNRLIIEIMESEVEPERIYERFADIRISRVVDLDRLHELTMSKIRLLDRDSDIVVADFVDRHFSTKRLFLMQIHPNGPMLRYLAQEVFRVCDVSGGETTERLDQIEQERGIGSYDAPIHPEIVDHFNLTWARGLTYRHHSEGYFDFEEFTRRYIRLDWTPSFYLGAHLARQGHLRDAEALLSDAARLNPILEFCEELQRVRRQLKPLAPPELVGTLCEYNIVLYDNRFLGIPQAVGPFEVDKVDLALIPGILLSRNLDDLREAIRARRTSPLLNAAR
jgi:hypothetical protein